ncbi:hypothetical protein ACHQM5_001959 [Ranunculus cassubicifolius]
MEKNGDKKLEGLPVESSPYVKYSDVEDYNLKAYGAQGHVEPVTGRGAGATDAPTPSGAAPATQSDGERHKKAHDIKNSGKN